jgi:hypothetical protein
MCSTKIASTPMSDSTRISKTDSPEIVDDVLRQEYMEMVGSLLYLSYNTRPDIAYACSQLGGMLQNPGPVHLVAAKRVIRYLKGTLNLGLIYRAQPWSGPGLNHPIPAETVIGYTDADWAGCADSRKSVSCYLTFMAGGPISWRMHKQHQNAMSSAESELIAMSGGARDLEYVRNTLKRIGIKELIQEAPTVLMSDSSAAIAIADKAGLRERTKHIDLRYFQMRGLQENGSISVQKIGTDYNPSDIGTKALGNLTFKRHTEVVVCRLPSCAEDCPQESESPSAAAMLAAISMLNSGAAGAWSTVRRKQARGKPRIVK